MKLFVTSLLLAFKFFPIFQSIVVKNPIVSITSADIVVSAMVFLLVYFIFIFFSHVYKFEMPFYMRDLVNDKEVIEENIVKIRKKSNRLESGDLQFQTKKVKGDQLGSFVTSKFIILAIMKNIGDLRGSYKYIPSLSNAGSLNTTTKRMRELYACKYYENNDSKLPDELKYINIFKDESYIPWRFKLTEVEGRLTEKEINNVEQSLKFLWEAYLDLEYDRVDNLKKN